MVYAGSLGKQKVSLGVSGRLKDNNLIMWDEETSSLWSQITGEALYGKQKGKKLGMLPAIFVGLSTWKKMHPETKVLDLSPVRQRGWFYTTKDLARASVQVRSRRGKVDLALGIGLRHDKETLVVDMSYLQQKKLVQVEVGGRSLALVWLPEHAAALVYEASREGQAPKLSLADGELKAGKQSYDALTGKAAGNDSPALARFPYLPTYLKAWKTYYPNGKVLR